MSTEAEALGERIAETAAHLDAGMHRLLTDLREYDRSPAILGWTRNGLVEQNQPDRVRVLELLHARAKVAGDVVAVGPREVLSNSISSLNDNALECRVSTNRT